MPDDVITIIVPEVDDTAPGLVTFYMIEPEKVAQITAGFEINGTPTVVKCDGQTYRAFMVERTKPNWWVVSAVRLNMPVRAGG